MKKYDKIILVVLLLVFAVGIGFTARSAFESYVTFAEAREATRNVQVKGVALEGTVIEHDLETWSFELEDLAGETQRVSHQGNIPPNLFEADNVVVVGQFDDNDFVASQILVKCPSKYAPEEE
ncbi:cytochrome c maturation protein CcmE [Dethiobacter alkaliphilus]|uniref:cytochrome c maturation protein CcmE n=1 Tax=Dethiobacter alkaliphilus TaxID=427926 RepID=UPI002225ECB2|nr:cytochrome c maturation protein CcmE [Dethiobacter alkaliphilus]MCW3491134.1 cytochrome c maturation protein CcmE [Dethiobacter alkaliphilus]